MAIIRINPTWIATETRVGGYPNHTYKYDYNWPLKSEYGTGIRGSVGFDMELIKRILTTSYVRNKTFVSELTNNATLTDIGIVLHDSSEPPSPTHEIYPVPTTGPNVNSISNEVLRVDIDTALYLAGPTRPVPIDLLGSINEGYKGFLLDPLGYYEANSFYIELEGDFDNPRPTPSRPVGGEIQNTSEQTRFQWSHNSPFKQTKFELRYRWKGTSAWTTVSRNTSDQFYNLPANTLTNGEYEWQVRTTSEFDFISPWSLVQVFNAAHTTPTPVLISPTHGQVMPTQNLAVQWDLIANQHEYEIELIDDTGVVKQAHNVSPANRVVSAGWLENGKAYILRVRARAVGELWSAWAWILITVEYTAPAKPLLYFVEDEELSAVKVYIENPTPTGTQPTVIFQDLYKRENGGDWIKIAKDLPPNAQFIDYTPINGITEYRVNALGDNEVRVMSDNIANALKIEHSILSLAKDGENYIRLIMNPERSFDIDFNAVKKKFSGRKKPVAEFGETIAQEGSLSYLIKKEEFPKLSELLYKQETLLYRNSRGRKIFGIARNMNATDDIKLPDYYIISFSFSEVDYKEGIS